jgi:branched-chain amino acid transport system substrate-binding protein
MRLYPSSRITAGIVGIGLGIAGAVAPATADDNTIVLGSAISLTGKYSSNGIITQRGYDLGVKRINEMGGVKIGGKTYKLAMKYYDDESTPLRTAELFERLIKQDGIKLLVGPYSSATTKAAAPITEKYEVPMVEAEAASRSLFTQGYKYMFGLVSTSEQYVESTIDLAAETAKKAGRDPSSVTVAMTFENDPFSLDVRAGAVARAKKYGMKIVVDDKLPRDLNDMSATVTKVKALKPDLLIVSGHEKGAATAVRQLKEMRVDVPMVMITQCEAAEIVKKFGKKATEGILCPTQWAPSLNYKGKYFGTAEDYAKLFKKTYSEYSTVPYQAASATAALIVWKEALEKADSLDPKKIRDTLAKLDLMTFYGPIKFDSTGKNPEKPMVLRQIQDGAYKVVAPTKYATAKLEYPRAAGY